MTKKTATNIGFSKAGLVEVIEHLYFYHHLYLSSANVFQSPAFANLQTVSCDFYKTTLTK